MTKLRSFNDIDNVLKDFIPPMRSFRSVYTLDTMRALMLALGNPQNSYKTIHVAGTSGKTSTSYYIAALLGQTGKKIGLSVSPHVDNVNERVQIDLVPLDEHEYCQQFSTFLQIINKLRIKPTYFELLIAFAFWQFAQEKVDYAVIEVGLGGLLDGTNVIERSDKVCVIADIGLDHVAVLGNSLAGIAAQKAGITGAENPVFCFSQSKEIDRSIKEIVLARGGEIHMQQYSGGSQNSSVLPLFQQRNFSLAYLAFQYICVRDNLTALTVEQEVSAISTYIPGRIEITQVHGKTLVLDAAHNAQKMEALVASLVQKYPGKKFAVLFALMKSNDAKVHDVLSLLQPITRHLIITDFVAREDLRKHSLSPDYLALEAKSLGIPHVQIIFDTDAAYQTLIKLPEDHMLITGSFYLLHDIHAKIIAR